MDSTNQTAIQSALTIDHLVFDEISFQRKGFKRPEETEVHFEIASNISKFADGKYSVTLAVVAEKNEEFEAKVRLTAYCSIEESNPDKDVILQENTVAIMLPYARAQMSLLTAQPETDTITLPVLNVHEMVQNMSEK